MAKKQFNNFQWDGEFQSKPKHNPKPGKQSSTGTGNPFGKPATQSPSGGKSWRKPPTTQPNLGGISGQLGSAFKPSKGNNTNTRKPRGKGIDLSRPADANIQDPPELWTGVKRSLHLSRRHEGNLYRDFVRAGGESRHFFAKARGKHILREGKYKEIRDTSEVLRGLRAHAYQLSLEDNPECAEGDLVCQTVAAQYAFETASSNYNSNRLQELQALTSRSTDQETELKLLIEARDLYFERQNSRDEILLTLFQEVGINIDSAGDIFNKGQEGIWDVIDHYQQEMLAEFGITIAGYDWGFGPESARTIDSLSEIALRLEVLYNYRQGALSMGSWLLETFPDQLGDLDEAQAFQLVLGNIRIERADVLPAELADLPDSIGVTTDRIVYDRFDTIGFRSERFSFPAPMTASNVLHEFAHAFVNSSGSGSWLNSPLYDGQSGAHSEQTLALDALLEPPAVEGTPGTPNEALANLIEALAEGTISFESLRLEGIDVNQLINRLNNAFGYNILRNLSWP